MINVFLREVQVKNQVVINCYALVKPGNLAINDKTLVGEGKEFSHFLYIDIYRYIKLWKFSKYFRFYT